MTHGMMLVVSLALSAVVMSQPAADHHTIERSFAAGGIVTMNLASGDYTVRAGATDRVRVSWRAEDRDREKDMKRIEVTVDAFERVVTIRTTPIRRNACSRRLSTWSRRSRHPARTPLVIEEQGDLIALRPLSTSLDRRASAGWSSTGCATGCAWERACEDGSPARLPTGDLPAPSRRDAARIRA